MSIVTGIDLLKELCSALEIDISCVRRIVLDVPHNGLITAYIEQFASTKILDIDYGKHDITIKEIANVHPD